MLKHAESGTGGIPRRAFNNPRALESLASSNLSDRFVVGGSVIPNSVSNPQGGVNIRQLNQQANRTGVIYVTPDTARTIVSRTGRTMSVENKTAINNALEGYRRDTSSFGQLPAIGVPYQSFLEARRNTPSGGSPVRPYRAVTRSTQKTPLQQRLSDQRYSRLMRKVDPSQIGD